MLKYAYPDNVKLEFLKFSRFKSRCLYQQWWWGSTTSSV